MTFAPTAEQQAAIDAAKTGENVLLEAGAGSGKTSTLKLIADALAPLRGLYMAYNKAIQVEAAKKFPANVTCKTAHSLAFAEFGKPRLDRFGNDAPRTAAFKAADILNIQRFVDGDDKVGPRQIAVVVREAIGNFCNSADDRPQFRHIFAPEQLSGDAAVRFRRHVMPYVEAAWADLCDVENGRLTQPYMSHDAYLKMWSLSKPQLGYSFILFDEAQDANPCIAQVVEAQHCQQIMVGDRAQAIYGWRGAIDAMQNFKAQHVLQLSQSFRFGQSLAEYANRWLRHTGSPLQITGFNQVNTDLGAVENPDSILCRTNAGVIMAALAEQRRGRKVAITGGTREIESFVKAAVKLMEGREVEHPQLGIYKGWDEVLEAVESGDAADIGPMVRLIDKYSTDDILHVCATAARPSDADVTCSTAHKAKGLEWAYVRIHGDFLPPRESEDGTPGKLSKTEAMLIYVAVTRATTRLDNGALDWLDMVEAEMDLDNPATIV